MKQLALLGGKPSIDKKLTRAQHYQPQWPAISNMVEGIFDRKYYTNHGYLAQQLERNISDFLGVKHTIAMTNTGIGLMIAVKALDLKGTVILPAFSHISIVQAVVWAGLRPIFCDVKSDTCHIDEDSIEQLIEKDTSAIFGVNLFGATCAYDKIDAIAASKGITNAYVSSEAIGQTYKGKKVGNYGSIEIFSLNEENIINSADGCLITTNSDHVAARLRNIRSSYGSGPIVPIAFTGNGRMSEIQAGLALLSLDSYNTKVKENEDSFNFIKGRVRNIEGIHLYQATDALQNKNYSTCVLRVNEEVFGVSAAVLKKALDAENIEVKDFRQYAVNPFSPFNVMREFPNAHHLSQSLLALPVYGKAKDHNYLHVVCDVMELVSKNATKVKEVSA